MKFSYYLKHKNILDVINMSILDKKFIELITNKSKSIKYYDQYSHYLKNEVKNLLTAELLSHIFEGSGSDITAFLLYKYEDKYILIQIQMGTCSGCKSSNRTYNSIIDRSLEACYISTNLDEVENYYLKCLKNVEGDSEIRIREHLYYIHPDWPF